MLDRMSVLAHFPAQIFSKSHFPALLLDQTQFHCEIERKSQSRWFIYMWSWWLLNTILRSIPLSRTSFAEQKVYDWLTVAEKWPHWAISRLNSVFLDFFRHILHHKLLCNCY
jgi:hypothetical protein